MKKKLQRSASIPPRIYTSLRQKKTSYDESSAAEQGRNPTEKNLESRKITPATVCAFLSLQSFCKSLFVAESDIQLRITEQRYAQSMRQWDDKG